MNKFKILKYWGYFTLTICVSLILMLVSGLVIYSYTPSLEPVITNKMEKSDTVEVVKQPIIINNSTVEKTTIIQSTEPVKPEPVKIEIDKPQSVVTPPIIDTTKTKDTL